jgi:hypothetical protein
MNTILRTALATTLLVSAATAQGRATALPQQHLVVFSVRGMLA